MGVLQKWVMKESFERPQKNQMRVLGTSVQYEAGSRLSYMLFEMERMDDSGQWHHFYKAIRLMRLVRVPKNQDTYFRLMEKHSEILSALWENQVHFVTLVANLIEPPLGLLFCYGAQGVAGTIEVAKKECEHGFRALEASLKGTFGTIELSVLTHEETEHLRKKIHAMDNVSMFRGIPHPHHVTAKHQMIAVDPTGSNMKGMIDNKTMEEFVLGMGDYEYVYMSLCTPIKQATLQKWLKLSSREATDWRKLMNQSFNVGFNISLPMAFGGNLGSNQGWGEAHSDSTGTAYGTSHTFTEGVSDGTTVGNTHGTGSNEGKSETIGEGTTHGVSDSTTWTDTKGQTHTEGYSDGITHTTGSSNTRTDNHENSTTTVKLEDHASSSTSQNSENHKKDEINSQGGQSSTGWISQDVTKTYDNNDHVKTHSTDLHSKMNLAPTIEGLGGGYTTDDQNKGTDDHGWGTDNSKIDRGQVSDGKETQSVQFTDTSTKQNTSSDDKTDLKKDSTITTIKEGVWSEGKTTSTSDAKSHSQTVSDATSSSHSDGGSHGKSDSNSVTKSVGQTSGTSISDAISKATSHTRSQSSANGTTEGISKSVGDTKNFSSGFSTGTTGSVGLAQGLSITHGFSWVDTRVENIVKMILFQNERILRALNGQGAYYVDTFVATQGELSGHVARSLGKNAFMYKDAYAQPFQAIEPSKIEQAKLLYHMAAFSPCLDMEGIPGQMESYKWSTMLLPDEACALTHPPRVSEGGIWADVEDMPRFAVPADKQFGEVYVGTVLSSERYSMKNGYKTNFKFCIRNPELTHAVFQGEARSGKTVSAMRVVAEWSKVRRASGKRLRFLILDPKNDWRKLVRVVDKERFRFYTVAELNKLTLMCNLLIVPPNVYPEKWINLVAENFALHYKMNVKGIQIITEAMFRVYERADCFVEDWQEVATERSRKVTLAKVYDEVGRIQDEKRTQKVSPNEIDAYERVLQRLQDFKQPHSILSKVFNTGLGIHEILGDDHITVIEAKGLKKEAKNFIYGIIFCGVYEYAIANGSFMSDDQYETVAVIEEANETLTGQTAESSEGGQSIFESIIDQAPGNGFYCFSVTQKIMVMPASIRANSGIKFYGRTADADAINWMITSIGRNPRTDRELVGWFARQPDLVFVAKTSRTTDFKDAEPVLISVDRLPLPPTVEDQELVEHKNLYPHAYRATT